MGRSKSTSLPVRKVHTNIQDSHLCEKGKANLAGYQLYGTWLRFCAVEKLKVVSLKQTQLPAWPCSNLHDSNKMHKTLWIRAIPWLVLYSTLIWWIVTIRWLSRRVQFGAGWWSSGRWSLSSSSPSIYRWSVPRLRLSHPTSTTVQRLPQCNVYHNPTSTTMQHLPQCIQPQCIQPQCIILFIVIPRCWDHSHPHIVMHPRKKTKHWIEKDCAQRRMKKVSEKKKQTNS